MERHPGVIGQNAPSEPAHTGTWDAWLDGYGTTHTDTLSQTVTIPAACTNAPLFSFWLHIDTAETTKTTRLRQADHHRHGTTLATFSNLNPPAATPSTATRWPPSPASP